MTTPYLTQLREQIIASFSDGELRTLCCDLGADYEDLPGEGRADKARELVAYMQRRGRVPEIASLCAEWRPHLAWIEKDIPLDPSRPANPFSDRGCIKDSTRFFDRERIRREMQQMLRAGNSISLVGDPQVGKSSLLRHLHQAQAEWLPGGRALYVDVQGIIDEDDFCAEVLEHLGQAAGDLRALRRALNGQRVVLMLDEIEQLTAPGFTTRLQDVLRALAQADGLALVVASQRRLTAVFPPSGPTSPFHNIFTEKQLRGFDVYTCREFLPARLAGTGVTFTDEEIERLVGGSGGHPGRLQRLAYDFFERKVG
jgi:hypothetical protein